jgi:uncharacterized membrane protein
MTRANASAEEPLLFRARLSPNRSLGAGGQRLVIGALAVASLTIGSAFMALGAWPVPGFLGLDVLAVYGAFRLRDRRAAGDREDISVTRERLTVRRSAAGGAVAESRFNPYWTRLELDRRASGLAGLWLVSRGTRLAVGSFLGPDERERLAVGLGAALAAARAVPR